MSTYFTRIAASGFKVRAFDLELAPVTLLTGCNATGKTAVIQALELAATSRIGSGSSDPKGAANTPAQIYERFASGQKMDVAGYLSNGVTLSKWYGCKSDKVTSGGVDNTNIIIPPVLFDQSEFLGLSGKERTKYLFRVLPPLPLDKVGPVAVVTALKQMRFEPHTEAHTASVNAMCRLVESDHAAAIQNPLGKLVEAMVKSQVIEKKFGADYIGGSDASALCTVQDWLVLMCEQIRLKCNAAVAAAKRMRETCLGVTQLKAPDAASLSQMEHEKQQAQAALEAAGAALATCREQYRSKDAQVKEAERVAASYVAPEQGARERLQVKVEELEQVLKTPTNNSAALTQLADSIRSTERQITCLIIDPKAEKIAADAWNAAVSRRNETGAALAVVEAEVTRLETQIAAASKEKICPHCKQSVEEIQKQVVAGLKKNLRMAVQAVHDATAAHSATKSPEALALKEVESLNAIRAKRSVLQDALNQSQSKLATLRQIDREALDQTRGLLDVTRGQIASLDIAAAQAAPAKAAQDSLPTLREMLTALERSGKDAHQEHVIAQQNLSLADQAYKKALADAASARTTAQAAEAADKAQAEADVLKELQRYLADLLAKCVELSVGPLVDTCNAMVTGILTAPVAVQEGEIGLLRGGKLAPWQACSDSEQMLMFAGLKLALAAKSEVRLAIVPRLESVDYKLKPVFVRRMLELVAAGKVDQVIMVEVASEPFPQEWYGGKTVFWNAMEKGQFKAIEVK